MSKQVLFIVISSCLSSCIQSFIIPGKIKRNFTFCYDGNSKGLDSLININGYYEELDIWWNTSGGGEYYNPRWDTSRINFIFFDDGICAYEFWCGETEGEECFDSNAVNERTNQITGYYKGLYHISGDTIKIQVINDVRWAAPTWSGREFLYKVIDKNSLKYIGKKLLDYGNEFRSPKEDSLNNHIARFIPVNNLPQSNIWLMKRKWFWCDEAQYKAWRKERRTK